MEITQDEAKVLIDAIRDILILVDRMSGNFKKKLDKS